MSNSEVPQPQQPQQPDAEQPGAQPPVTQPPATQPPAGHVPPARNVPPAGYQPPPAYPQPGQAYPAPGQAYPQPGQPYNQPGQPGGFRFEMPTDGPRNFNDVMPKAGFSGMFSVTGLPTELKVSYWIWLIGGMLGVLGGLFGVLGSLALFVVAPGLAVVVLLLVLVALALAAAQIVLVLKMKEGKEWARLALTIVAGVSLVLAVLGGSVGGGGMGQGIGNNWLGFLISAAATVLMWLPNSQAWFNAAKGRA
ncbi:hypothetical protein NG697_09725 [Pseudarthrobacter sp. MDT3-26]|uniref:hypothetical protein n=1 Tax=Pseudarthrobacter raffinosi TaxID=2953651 RepID=UPI00208E677D|nr:hypothetical protein [Pseudarthrobacter sp. MDT3-26]MCO4263187.1 hypothetical protein [Pseudarthrobacter sp. MDT3-26]